MVGRPDPRYAGDQQVPGRGAGKCRGLYEMLRIAIEREDDGRWIGEVPDLPGVLAYGASEAEARIKTTALALRVIADRLENGEQVPFDPRILFIAA